MKKTKIICTLGPASNNRETLKALMENGMDIARFNFSHGDHEEQKGRVDMIKELREELDMPIAMLLDTKGPEIRTRLFKRTDRRLSWKRENSLYLELAILKATAQRLLSHMRHFTRM